jgi:hypothetical protein
MSRYFWLGVIFRTWFLKLADGWWFRCNNVKIEMDMRVKAFQIMSTHKIMIILESVDDHRSKSREEE